MSYMPAPPTPSRDRGMDRFRCVCALLFVLLLGAAPVLSQTPPAQTPAPVQPPAASTKMDEGVRELSSDPRMRSMSQQQQRDLIEFVTGNMLFVGFHELGHAVIQQLGLPVLGRAEDAADSFATIALLKIGTDFSYNVLVQAARGWFLSARRDHKEGDALLFYDEHGLDKQRAYQIVCLMVGSNEDQFKELADWVQMPASRQDTCAGDYSNAQFSWNAELKPHLRAPDQPKSKIDVAYDPVAGKLDVYARTFRAIGFLETIAGYAADLVVWPHPISVVMQGCGDANASWNVEALKEILCYEMADDFAELYTGYTENRTALGKRPANQLLARNIRRLRIQHSMSQDHLATGAGLNKTWLNRVERAQENASVAQLDQLARALRVETSELFKQEDAQAAQAPPQAAQAKRRSRK